MTSRGHWRDRLLGTLQGQLQLATYVTVFLGFTGASCAGLWISERTLFRQHSMAIEQSAAGIALALERLPDPPSRLRVQQQLESISDKRTIFWFQQADGSLIFPRPPLQPQPLFAGAGPGAAIAAGDHQCPTALPHQRGAALAQWSQRLGCL